MLESSIAEYVNVNMFRSVAVAALVFMGFVTLPSPYDQGRERPFNEMIAALMPVSETSHPEDQYVMLSTGIGVCSYIDPDECLNVTLAVREFDEDFTSDFYDVQVALIIVDDQLRSTVSADLQTRLAAFESDPSAYAWRKVGEFGPYTVYADEQFADDNDLI